MAPAAASTTTFGKKLADQRRSRGTHGDTDGNFAVARAPACEHQVRQVCAGNQKNKGGNCEQKPQRCLVARAKGTHTRRSRIRGEPKRFESFDRIGTVICRRHRLEDSCAESVQMRRGSLNRPTRPQPAHYGNVENVASKLLRSTQRLRDVERISDGHTEKPRRCHADDIDELEVDTQARRGSQLAAPHLPLPEVVTDDGGRRRAGRRFICHLNQSTTVRLHAKAGEELPADGDAVGRSQFASLTDTRLTRAPREESGERLLMVAKLLPHRPRQLAVGGRVQAKAPVAPDDSDVDELRRIWNGQRAERQGVDQLKDCRVRTNAQRQREDRGDREGRCPGEVAEGVAEVIHKELTKQ